MNDPQRHAVNRDVPMRSRLFIALAVSLGVASSHLTAAEAPAGRYQLAVYQPGVLGQSLVLLDTATGDTWLLDTAPAPLPDGSSGTKPTWFALEKSPTPMPAARSSLRRAAPTTQLDYFLRIVELWAQAWAERGERGANRAER